MTEPTAPWPHARSSRDGVVARFGARRADLVGWALVTGDPLADAVVEEIQSGRPGVHAVLNAGIRHGLEFLTDAPPAVVALLTSTETRAAAVDDELVDHGTAPFFSVPNPVHMVSLSAGALVRVYESPSIATVLATTGRLIDGAQRRLEETGKWLMLQMLPGGLRCGRPGYVATLQVRMLHAHMRHLARSRGYDETAFGAPINQVDLARTWMDFTVTAFRFEEMLGYGYTASELTTLYRYWQFAANVLGIDHRLVEGISTNEQARRVDDLFQAVTGPPIERSGTLATATINAVSSMVHDVINVPPWMAIPALRALVRRYHGDTMSDELRIPRVPVADALLGPAIHVLRTRRARLRQDAAAWQAAQKESIAAAREMVRADTAPAGYEQQAA
ncbi:MAG: hypothetical protein JWO13_3888 [Acidobacteriales bacterium]|nr:hypothetical protein [Terriglobales bacterium]